MTMREQIILVADAFAAVAGIGRKRISTIVLGRGSKLDDIADRGRDLFTGSFEHSMQWFSDHWPEGAVWPADVPRPVAHVPSPVETKDGGEDAARHGNAAADDFRGEDGR